MDKKIIIGIVIAVLVILGGVGAFFYFQGQQEATPLPTPTTAPIIKQEAQPVVSIASPETLSASQSATLDIMVDTKGIKIDGFQFIATIEGTAGADILDADSVATGVQIAPETLPQLTVATNSVVAQDGKQVIRFAMITAAGNGAYTTTGPTKVASITLTPQTAGSLQLAFNPQNSRASKSTGGDDVLFTTTDRTLVVSASTGTVTQTTVAPTPIATSTASAQLAKTSTTNPSCRLSCATDNDCAAGLSCEFGLCVNPACSSSQTCSCTVTTQASQTPSPSPATSSATIAQAATSSGSASTSTKVKTATATATPKPTATAQATLSAQLAQADLPVSGTVENTIFLLAAGFLFIGIGLIFAK